MPLSLGIADEDQQSPTPIYDALYATYRQSFRTLPGDRADEDDFTFVFGLRGPDESSETGKPGESSEPGEGPEGGKGTTLRNRPGPSPALPPLQRGNHRKRRGNRRKGR